VTSPPPPHHHAPPQRAIVWALLAAALFGASTPLARHWATQWPAVLVAGLLYAGSGLGLTVLLALRTAALGIPTAWPQRAQWPWLLAATAAGGMLAPVLLMLGLARVPASSASLLLNVEGVATAALAWWVFGEATDRRVMLGMLCIVLGGDALAWPQQQSTGGLSSFADPSGVGLIVAACVAWGVDNNLTRKVADVDPLMLAAIKGVVAAAVNLGLSLALTAAPWPDWHSSASLMGLGLLGYGVSLALFVLALRGLGAARTGAYFGTAPFIGAALGVGLGDAVTLPLAVAALLMAIGLWLHLSERHEHPHWHGDVLHSHPHYPDHEHRHEHS
jgi:drug/metabolite transporter (DMT)-like permease